NGGAVSIGRGAEPADALGRVRGNDLAFSDARDGVSETVARAHARIEFEPSAGIYLLFNESSTNPTFLLRDGRSLRVAPRDRRGVRLTSGDALQLGRALVMVAIDA
ncbi:MAG TPA: FHA domain-containing protein, partial [Vicinamibacterales bacterium]|nr:FHA domain-containing protein [Vicinamibacterales bacterium]